MIVLVYLVLLRFAGEPVIIRDSIVDSGNTRQSLRFRSTGQGTSGFREIGRFLRQYGIDELPGLWSVIRGNARLKDVGIQLFG